MHGWMAVMDEWMNEETDLYIRLIFFISLLLVTTLEGIIAYSSIHLSIYICLPTSHTNVFSWLCKYIYLPTYIPIYLSYVYTCIPTHIIDTVHVSGVTLCIACRNQLERSGEIDMFVLRNALVSFFHKCRQENGNYIIDVLVVYNLTYVLLSLVCQFLYAACVWVYVCVNDISRACNWNGWVHGYGMVWFTGKCRIE